MWASAGANFMREESRCRGELQSREGGREEEREGGRGGSEGGMERGGERQGARERERGEDIGTVVRGKGRHDLRSARGLTPNPKPRTPNQVNYDKTPELLASNPNGLVPTVLRYDDAGKLVGSVYESMICVEYVDEIGGGKGGRLFPVNVEQRARCR